MTSLLILLIEDDVFLGRSIAEVIEMETPHQCEVIQDGQVAIQRLQGAVADLVLLDLHLPNVSGIEILAQMRADARWAQTKIVVMTADVIRAKDAERQADRVMLKPVSINDILGLFSDMLKTDD